MLANRKSPSPNHLPKTRKLGVTYLIKQKTKFWPCSPKDWFQITRSIWICQPSEQYCKCLHSSFFSSLTASVIVWNFQCILKTFHAILLKPVTNVHYIRITVTIFSLVLKGIKIQQTFYIWMSLRLSRLGQGPTGLLVKGNMHSNSEKSRSLLLSLVSPNNIT